MEVAGVSPQLVSVEALLQDERSGFLGAHAIQHLGRRYTIREELMDINIVCGYSASTFLKTMILYDAAMNRMGESPKLVGIACLGLAAAMNETTPKDLDTYSAHTDYTYSTEEIDSMQVEVFKILGCSASVPSELDYLDVICSRTSVSRSMYNLSLKALKLISLNGSAYLPSVRATSALYIAGLVLGRDVIDNTFGVDKNAVYACCDSVRELKYQPPPRWGLLGIDVFAQVVVAKASTHSDDYLTSTHFIKNIGIVLIDKSRITYMPGDRLGKGGYGVVSRCKYDGTEYAAKLSIVDSDETLSQSEVREISIMLSLSHKNVVNIFHITDDLYRVLLPVGWGDLRKWIDQHAISEDEEIEFARQMLRGLTYIHSCGVLHRDIKPQNIIVFLDNGSPTYKISDFGSARGCGIGVPSGPYTTGICTLWYRSPELLLGSRTYNDRHDVWSMLCVLYEFATTQVLFKGYEQNYDHILKIFVLTGMPNETTWPGVSRLPVYKHVPSHQFKGRRNYFGILRPLMRELLEVGLVCDPRQRPSAYELLDKVHEYIGM